MIGIVADHHAQRLWYFRSRNVAIKAPVRQHIPTARSFRDYRPDVKLCPPALSVAEPLQGNDVQNLQQLIEKMPALQTPEVMRDPWMDKLN